MWPELLDELVEAAALTLMVDPAGVDVPAMAACVVVLVSRTVTPEPRRHVTMGRSHDLTRSDPPRDQSCDQMPKPASNQSCDKEREHDLMHAYFCRRNLCYIHDRY